MHVSLSFSSTARASQIRTYLSDPDKFVSVHPLIYRMEALPDGRFRVFERVSIGPISYSFTYPATIHVEEGRVVIRVHVMRLVHIAMTFSFVEEPKGTRITEVVDIRTLLPVKRFMRGLIGEQHALMFAAIDRATEVRG